MSYSDRFVSLYLKHQCSQFIPEVFADLVSATGLSLTFLGTSSVTLFIDVGTQQSVSIQDFFAALEHDRLIKFQIWWNEYEDIYCSVEKSDLAIIIHFALDGNSNEHARIVTDSLKHIFDKLATRDAVWGMIIDLEGCTCQDSWKALVTEQSLQSLSFPHEILLPIDSQCLKNLDKESVIVSETSANVVSIQPRAC